MTWFVLLAVVLGVISVAWLTRALWRPSTTLAMTLAVFDFAYALAMANQRNLQGEPLKLIDRALAIDAVQPKALALAGTAAFDRRDYALAVKYWEKLAQTQPPDSAFGRQVQPSIAEARRLGGMSAPVAAPTAPVAAASSAQVSGTVTLAASLKGKVSPNDTVFVFARAVDG